LFTRAKNPIQAKVSTEEMQFCKLHLALKEQSGFQKCRTMRKQVLLFNLLESVGVHSEASLNTCRGFVGPSQALCQVQVALSLISP